VQASGVRELEPVRLADRDEVLNRMRAGETILGPELSDEWPAARQLFPDAAMIGQLASQRTDFVAGERLEPIYLRETRFVKAPPPRVIPLV